MSVCAPTTMLHNFSKQNIQNKNFTIMGVMWETADFLCENQKCRHVTNGYGNYVTNLKKENEKLHKGQSQKMSFIESLSNTAIGFGIALASQQVIFPMYNIHVAFETNVILTTWFTGISIARGYIVRRFFNKR